MHFYATKIIKNCCHYSKQVSQRSVWQLSLDQGELSGDQRPPPKKIWKAPQPNCIQIVSGDKLFDKKLMQYQSREKGFAVVIALTTSVPIILMVFTSMGTRL